MSKIGYARVSTKEQNLDRQIKALEEVGCDKIFMEKISGKDRSRPELTKMLEYIRESDVLYIHELSRLGRSLHDLISISNELESSGVDIVFMKEGIDTSTPSGRFFFHLMSSVSEWERTNTLQRQAEGIAIAKEKGLYKGRPAKQPTAEDILIVQEWHDGKITATKACSLIGISRATLYRRYGKTA